jgi:hypothetical protein
MVMMLVGSAMVAFGIATMLIGSNPLPIPVAVIGLVFVAVGSRKNRSDSYGSHLDRRP